MKKLFYWILRLVPAIILLQTLFFKFSAAPESVYIFTKLGLEPYGRIGIGILELIAGIMLLIPFLSGFGAVLSLGLMAGALFSHLTQLGIEVQNDKGFLFLLALIVAIFSLIISFIEKNKLFLFLNLLKSKLIR